MPSTGAAAASGPPVVPLTLEFDTWMRSIGFEFALNATHRHGIITLEQVTQLHESDWTGWADGIGLDLGQRSQLRRHATRASIWREAFRRAYLELHKEVPAKTLLTAGVATLPRKGKRGGKTAGQYI